MLSRLTQTLFTAVLLSGCGNTEAPPGTGGTEGPGGVCGRGLVALNTDYATSNISLVGVDGAVVSSSFYSSTSKDDPEAPSKPPVALSGDVALPTARQSGDKIALIDRSLGFVKWVDVKSGKATGTLLVGPTIPLNPQDYIEVSANKAYVTTLDPKLDPNLSPLEKGSNILIVDPAARSIKGAIDLMPAMAGEDPKFYPHPGRGLVVGDKLYVLLWGFDIDYNSSAVSRLVTIDTAKDAIVAVDKIDGMHDCTGIAISPSQEKIAVTCSGEWQVDPTLTNPTSDPATSGLVIFSRSDAGITEQDRWFAKDLGGGALGFAVSFVSEGVVAFNTIGQGAFHGQPARDDTFVSFDLATAKPTTLLRDPRPGSIGDVRCLPACDACFVTEAGTQGKALHRFTIEGGSLGKSTEIAVDPAVGLPPRYLGQF